MQNKFTTPKFGENVFLQESNHNLHKKIAKQLKKRSDIYWSEEVGALVEVSINGQQRMLPVFQTKTEALAFSKGSEDGFRNIICKFRVRYFETDYLKNNSNAFAVIGVESTKSPLIATELSIEELRAECVKDRETKVIYDAEKNRVIFNFAFAGKIYKAATTEEIQSPNIVADTDVSAEAYAKNKSAYLQALHNEVFNGKLDDFIRTQSNLISKRSTKEHAQRKTAKQH